MLQSLSHRAISLSLALLVTLGMLGGIQALTQTESQPAQWAQKAYTPRA